jgi:hypothetical protein
MSPATSLFRSQLREAVREARTPDRATPDRATMAQPPAAKAPPAQPVPSPAWSAPPRPARRTVVRLWLPLTPLWLILSPFAILFAPLLLLAPQTRGIRPYRAAFAVGALLFALSGTVVDVETPDALVRIRIY